MGDRVEKGKKKGKEGKSGTPAIYMQLYLASKKGKNGNSAKI